MKTAKKLGYPLMPTRVHSSDAFWCEENMDDYRGINQKHHCTCVDMESFALFHNAKVLIKNVVCLPTILDSFLTGEKTTAKERQKSFTMKKITLEACL